MPPSPPRIPLDDAIADDLYELFVVWSELADNHKLRDLRGTAAAIGTLCHRVCWKRMDAVFDRKAVRR